jgi:hypothetical protein
VTPNGAPFFGLPGQLNAAALLSCAKSLPDAPLSDSSWKTLRVMMTVFPGQKCLLLAAQVLLQIWRAGCIFMAIPHNAKWSEPRLDSSLLDSFYGVQKDLEEKHCISSLSFL